MSKLSPDIEKLLEHVDRVSGAPADTTELIRAAIESSPYLQKRMSTEIAEGNLERIAVRDGDKQWGHFDDPNRTAALDVDLFKQFAKEPERLEDAITYVLGHEVGHGNNMADRNRANRALNEDMRNAYWTDQPDGFTDITAAVDRYVRFAGTDETRAEIEGWNALASRIKQESGQVDRTELMTRAAPVSYLVVLDNDRNLVPAPGVKLGDDPYLTYYASSGSRDVSASAQAVSAVFYTPELQARYATHAVEVAASTARHFQEKTGQAPYETRLNLGAIGQSAKSLEAAGLDLDGKPFFITDTTHGLNWNQLRHTRDKNEPDKPAVGYHAQTRAFAPDQPGFRYYEQALDAIRSSTNIPTGTYTPDQEERLAGSLAKAALSNTSPLRAIDHVVVSTINQKTGRSDNVFAVQGGLHDPAHTRVHLPLEAALTAPLEESRRQVNHLAIARQQEQQQDLQQQQVQQQQGPVLS
jgi:hypothetical protein